jgi:FKBP-type peptidyl-prolyl cis-trans isomerase
MIIRRTHVSTFVWCLFVHSTAIVTVSSWNLQQLTSRANVLAQFGSAAAFVPLANAAASIAATTTDEAAATSTTTTTVYKLPSGLEYIETKVGSLDGPTPNYGQLVSIDYTTYIQKRQGSSSKRKLEKVDTAKWLYKHGNGRSLSGLDEGIHTMRVGGSRRLFIPASLGYTEGGGPVPESPWNRRVLNEWLEQEGDAATLVMDVTLLVVLDDEADQGE